MPNDLHGEGGIRYNVPSVDQKFKLVRKESQWAGAVAYLRI